MVQNGSIVYPVFSFDRIVPISGSGFWVEPVGQFFLVGQEARTSFVGITQRKILGKICRFSVKGLISTIGSSKVRIKMMHFALFVTYSKKINVGIFL